MVPLLLTAWVYWPILGAYFFADDFVCLLSSVNDGFVRFVFRPFGGHNLFARNLAFWASYRLFGLRADLFFWTVLLTHLLNVWLLFRVLGGLTGSLVVACLGATLWGTAPVQLGTLGWYAVYGQVLVGAIPLALLDRIATHGRLGSTPSCRAVAAWCGLLLVGTTCFGTGIAIALVFPLVAFLLLPACWRGRCQRLTLLALPLVTVATYFGLRRLFGLVEPLSFAEQIAGNPSLPRLQGALSVLPHFVDVAVNAGIRSFFFTTATYPDAWSRLTWVAFGAATLLLLWRGTSAERRATLGMAALAVAVYLMIGLGRQPRGNVTATWLATQPRYHYVGTIPVVIVAALAAGLVGRLSAVCRVPGVAVAAGALAVGAIGYARSDFRVDDHAQCRRALALLQRGIAAEILARPAGQTADLSNYLPRSILQQMLGPVMADEGRLFPGKAAVFLLDHPDGELNDRRVRFVERDPAVIAWHAQWPDTPLARVLVSPPQ